jgi:lipoprotein-releasing system permease protein
VYKLLLCWRYLLTRYLALACILSVMLGVGTLIVVNSVMGGFSTKLKERLHGILSDVLIEATSFDGFAGAEEKMARIRQDPFLADRIEAMTATQEVFAMLQFKFANGEMMTKPVRVSGIKAKERAALGGFSEHLVNPTNRENPSFELPADIKAQVEHRLQIEELMLRPPPRPRDPQEPPEPMPPPRDIVLPKGAMIGYLLGTCRDRESKGHKDVVLIQPGDEIILTTVSGERLAPVYDRFIVVDYYKSDMSEYDSNTVFVPLEHLQHLRTTQGRVTHIQIRLKDYGEAPAVVDRLKTLCKGWFPSEKHFQVSTWEDKQGPLLQAIAVEKRLLNLLLFLIIAVAGFGILAIFSMIVAEKTRDIGILKALGASNLGVLKIFLSYGLLLGLIGAGLGTALGLTITANINNIEEWLARMSGQDIFPRSVYYFDRIPTHIQPGAVLLVNLGAVAIAVLFSVLPAMRAALLHPVKALRYE